MCCFVGRYSCTFVPWEFRRKNNAHFLFMSYRCDLYRKFDLSFQRSKTSKAMANESKYYNVAKKSGFGWHWRIVNSWDSAVKYCRLEGANPPWWLSVLSVAQSILRTIHHKMNGHLYTISLHYHLGSAVHSVFDALIKMTKAKTVLHSNDQLLRISQSQTPQAQIKTSESGKIQLWANIFWTITIFSRKHSISNKSNEINC